MSQPLHLDGALQLLQHSGLTLPYPQETSSVGWLQAVIDGLCAISSSDPLTGLANRRQFELALAREIDRVSRTGQPALMLMIDLDHFKEVNDTYGHAVGDFVLVAIAQTLQECVRPMDTLARFGGDEFAMILPNCSRMFGSAVAERVRQKVQRYQVAITPRQWINMTVSIGGAFAPQRRNFSTLQWIERADQQLYCAKSGGRNFACLEQASVTCVDVNKSSSLLA